MVVASVGRRRSTAIHMAATALVRFVTVHVTWQRTIFFTILFRLLDGICVSWLIVLIVLAALCIICGIVGCCCCCYREKIVIVQSQSPVQHSATTPLLQGLPSTAINADVIQKKIDSNFAFSVKCLPGVLLEGSMAL